MTTQAAFGCLRLSSAAWLSNIWNIRWMLLAIARRVTVLEQFVLFCVFSLALRWWLFCYKHTSYFRSRLKNCNWSWSNDLLQCCYCQAIEASIIVYGLLWLTNDLNMSLIQILLSILTNGWIALALEDWFEGAVERIESRHE